MKRARVEVNLSELDQLLDQACQAPLSESDCQKIKAALHALAEWVTARRTTEKKKTVVPPANEDNPPAAGEGQPEEAQPNGHGRTAATAYAGADRVEVKHPELQHGDRCPECQRGNVYRQKEPKPLVRITGQAPLKATVYNLERLRCNACGQVYEAAEPEGVGPEKFDETASAMIAQLKYPSQEARLPSERSD